MSDYCVHLQQSLAQVSTFFVALHCCVNEKRTLFTKCANFIRHVFDTRADTNNPHDGFVHSPFKCLTHEGWFAFSDGLVPFGMLPCAALFPCLLSLFCNRGPSEGELGRSHLPLPFLGDVMFWDWMTLLWSTLLVTTIFCFSVFFFACVLCFPFGGSSTCCSVVSGIESFDLS